MEDDNSLEILAQIQEILDSGGTIDAARIREWMRSPSVTVGWAAVDLLLSFADRVSGLPERERNEFVLDHLSREIQAHHRDSRLPGPYVTGHSLRAWFERLWSTAIRDEDLLTELRQRLGGLPVSGCAQTRDRRAG